MKYISLVLASFQRLIGVDNNLPWHSPEDMKHFKDLTMGHTVIMGSTTFDSILRFSDGKLLPGRAMIVLSRSKNFDEYKNVKTARSLVEAFDMSEDKETFVIGGESVYKEAINFAKKIYSTKIDYPEYHEKANSPSAKWVPDQKFLNINGNDHQFYWAPDIDDNWEVVSKIGTITDPKSTPPNLRLTFKVYERVKQFEGSQIDPYYAKTGVYADLLKTATEDVCPLCPEFILNFHKKEIIQRDGNWFLTYNQHPYSGTDYHFLIISMNHIEKIENITVPDWTNILNLYSKAIELYGIEGASFDARSGKTNLTGATVKHLHFHIIVPKIDPSTGRAIPVNFPIG